MILYKTILFILFLDRMQQGQRSRQLDPPSQRNPTNIEGEIYDIIGNRATTLSWEQKEGKFNIIPGGSNASILNEFRGSIIKLWNDFFSGNSSVSLSSEQKQILQKRLFLLEHEIDGLLKRKINYTIKDGENGERVLDYTSLVNAKENRIVQLQAKIINLEAKLRMSAERERQLLGHIEKLELSVAKLEKPTFNKRQIQALFKVDRDYRQLQKQFGSLKHQIGVFSGLFNSHVAKLKENGVKFEYERQLCDLLNIEGLEVANVNGAAYIFQYRDRVVSGSAQQENMKLISLLAGEIKTISQKYPHLKLQLNQGVLQFIEKDILQALSGSSIVEIIKYVPEVVRVEDLYIQSSSESRKVQFHLRILIKVLIAELQRIAMLTGVALELDQGVIGLVQQQISEVVNVEDILKIYRSIPKTIEVEKIVEKVVQRVIQVPQIVPVEIVKQVPIEVIKYQQIEKIIHVPVEITKVVDRLNEKLVTVESIKERVVEVPTKHEVIVERIVETPKIITQEVFVQKIVEVEKPVIVEQIIHVPEPQPYPVQIIKEKVVQMEVIVEKPVPVDRIVEKIVTVYEHQEHPIEVEKRNDILVKEIEILPAREVVHVVDERTKTVTLESEKVVPFVEVKEKIVEVPKVIEKIVESKVEVVRVEQVPVIEQVIQWKTEIKQVEKIVQKIVTVFEEKIKQVEKIVEVPVIQQRIVKVPEIITQIVVEKSEIVQPVEVTCQVPLPIEVTKVVEVEKPVVHYIHEEVPVKLKVDNVIPVTKTVERIKEVRVNIDKIIEKMVEVPKVVEVEKIVEKVVVVPRVIQKIVEVPQIVEKVVDRIIQTEKIIEVQVESQVPIVKEKEVEIEVQKNFYFTNEVPVQVVREKIAEKTQTIEKVQVVKQYVDNIVETKVEVPRQIIIEKIVPEIHEVPQIVDVQKQIIVPFKEVQVVDRIREKVVPIEKLEEKIKVEVQEIEKIVEVKVEQVRIEVVEQKHEVPIIEKKAEIYRDQIPYIEKKVEQIRTVEEKVIHTQSWREEPRIVECIVQKVVPETVYKHEAHEFEAIKEVLIEVEKVKPVDNIKPILVDNIRVVPELHDVLVEIPCFEQSIKEVKVIEEKVVAIEHETKEMIEVPVVEEKVVVDEKLITKTDVRNFIERTIEQIVVKEDKIIPIHSTVEKIVEVPHILEKIVEKIVLLPQIVQVMKYVHEIVEKDIRVAVDVTVQEQQMKYKQVYVSVEQQFQVLLGELRKLKTQNPAFQVQIQIIEKFLAELNNLISIPRIVQIEKQVPVQVDKRVPVIVEKNSADAEKHQVTLSLIIHKLMGELLRVQQSNPNINLQIDKDILKIFASDFKYKDFFEGKLDLQNNLSMIYNYYEQILNSLGGSNLVNDQQLIYTSAVQERLINTALVREANIEIDKVKNISDQRNEAFKLLKQSFINIADNVRVLQGALETGNMNQVSVVLGDLNALIEGQRKEEGLNQSSPLDELLIHQMHEKSVRLDSAFREILEENERLRAKLLQHSEQLPSRSLLEDRDRIINTLQGRIVELSNEINFLKSQSNVSVKVTGNTQEYQLKIRTLNSRVQQVQSQLRSSKIDYEGRLRTKDHFIHQLQEKVRRLEEKVRIGDSRVTTDVGGTRYSSSQYSGGERMTSSIHSESSDSQTPNKTAQTTQPTTRYTGTYTSSNLKPEEGSGSSGVSYGSTTRVPAGNVTYGTAREVSNPSYATSRIGGGESTTQQTGSTSANTTVGGRTGYARTYGGNTSTTGTTGTNQSSTSASGVSYGRQYSTTTQPGQSSSSSTGYKYYSGSRIQKE